MRVLVMVLQLLPWKNKPIDYHFTNTERAKRASNNNNKILCIFLQKVGLILNFTNLFVSNQYFLLLLDIFYGFNHQILQQKNQ